MRETKPAFDATKLVAAALSTSERAAPLDCCQQPSSNPASSTVVTQQNATNLESVSFKQVSFDPVALVGAAQEGLKVAQASGAPILSVTPSCCIERGVSPLSGADPRPTSAPASLVPSTSPDRSAVGAVSAPVREHYQEIHTRSNAHGQSEGREGVGISARSTEPHQMGLPKQLASTPLSHPSQHRHHADAREGGEPRVVSKAEGERLRDSGPGSPGLSTPSSISSSNTTSPESERPRASSNSREARVPNIGTPTSELELSHRPIVRAESPERVERAQPRPAAERNYRVDRLVEPQPVNHETVRAPSRHGRSEGPPQMPTSQPPTVSSAPVIGARPEANGSWTSSTPETVPNNPKRTIQARATTQVQEQRPKTGFKNTSETSSDAVVSKRALLREGVQTREAKRSDPGRPAGNSTARDLSHRDPPVRIPRSSSALLARTHASVKLLSYAARTKITAIARGAERVVRSGATARVSGIMRAAHNSTISLRHGVNAIATRAWRTVTSSGVSKRIQRAATKTAEVLRSTRAGRALLRAGARLSKTLLSFRERLGKLSRTATPLPRTRTTRMIRPRPLRLRKTPVARAELALKVKSLTHQLLLARRALRGATTRPSSDRSAIRGAGRHSAREINRYARSLIRRLEEEIAALYAQNETLELDEVSGAYVRRRTRVLRGKRLSKLRVRGQRELKGASSFSAVQARGAHKERGAEQPAPETPANTVVIAATGKLSSRLTTPRPAEARQGPSQSLDTQQSDHGERPAEVVSAR